MVTRRLTERLAWLEHSGEVVVAHGIRVCAGQTCTLHNRSDHPMRAWPQHWRDDRGIMERICPHGTGHPDPDDITTDRVHGCDACCTFPTEAP